ncbi:ATP-dependent nuclease [Ekhidna sp. To15]|uniref:ATP-dependent nuclease n=1 Tax=Ekhidna sp. To15 TaxID=3395267 RepID=UPI003F526B7F
MKITGIELTSVRGFKQLNRLEFSKGINVLIGPNNTGKSTILNSIFQLQRNSLNSNDKTIGSQDGIIGLYFDGGHKRFIKENPHFVKIQITLNNQNKVIVNSNGGTTGCNNIPQKEPDNLIYPYLSKRKTAGYNDQINEEHANSVLGNFQHLYSKIDRLVTPQFQPGNSEYVKACDDILGFEISTLAKGNGKQAVQFIHNLEHIPLTAMGEGVSNMLGLITDLCIANDKIFLIEEPENDIHPTALKALLALIAEKSEYNQFFISTHSNIVMKHLGAVEDAKILQVSNNSYDNERPKLRLSSVSEVGNNPLERKKVLEDLGYDFFDYDLWKAWLFLEESSAEAIIRDYLIKWFTPNLKYELRTFSAGSTSKIHPKFEDFNKLFVFLHLEPTYKNKVWVFIDSGDEEGKIIEKMKANFSKSGWNPEQFNQFSKHNFEEYYPKRFRKQVKEVLELKDKQQKRNKKRELLEEVKSWVDDNEKQAKEEFKESASEIIDILKKIRTSLKSV